jgi:NitT/TauT family transport system substrate-binding protein
MRGLAFPERTEKGIESVSRRNFLQQTSALGAASLLGVASESRAEPPPETTRVKIFAAPVTCLTPQYIAQEPLLHAEGFTDVRFVRYPAETPNWPPQVLLTGEADFSFSFPPTDIVHIEKGDPVVILAGSHAGCVEVVAANTIRFTPELKGKTVAIPQLRTDEHIFISMFAAYVGLDPRKDINWVIKSHADDVRLLEEGKIDAFMAGPPATQELRAKKLGHVLVSTTTDTPWSHHTCCLVATTRDFVRKYPAATKRVLRAILKGNDLCAQAPERVAKFVADKGLGSYEAVLKTLQELPYGKWREYNPEDALRFYALRMREVGFIKSSPQQIIAQGTDWRFLNELKKEMKA